MTSERAASRAAGYVLLLVVGLVVPLAIASHYGALGVPRSDDWSYLVTLFRWVDTGHLAFNRWVSMTLLGQLVATVPVVEVFGRSVWVVQVWSALLGFVGLVAIVRLGRRLAPGGRGALLVAVTVAVGPLWGTLATTYMTDVPSLVAQVVALACAARAFTGRFHRGWFFAALAAAVFGFSIRQYGVVTVLAIVLVAAALAREGRAPGRLVVVASAVALGACAVILALWAGVPDPLAVSPSTPSPGTVSTTFVTMAGFLRLTALLLVPVLAYVGPVRIVRAAWAAGRGISVALVVGVAALLTVTYVRSPRAPFVGNYVDRVGALANDVVAGTRPDVMPRVAFDAMVLVAGVAAVVLVLAAVPGVVRLARRWSDGDRHVERPELVVVAWALAGLTVAYAFAVLVDLPIFDRYGLVLVPLAGILLISTPPGTPRPVPDRRRMLAGTVVAVLALAFVGLVYATDSASFDATRWSVATRATHHGYRPLQVYGGFEWLGWHRKLGPARSDSQEVRQRSRLKYFRHLCVDVVVRPSPALAAHAIVRDEIRGGWRAPVPIVAARVDRPC
ncbi:MAG: glycosyltransferase family 39 protein [Acidimicrobiia bacterium]